MSSSLDDPDWNCPPDLGRAVNKKIERSYGADRKLKKTALNMQTSERRWLNGDRKRPETSFRPFRPFRPFVLLLAP